MNFREVLCLDKKFLIFNLVVRNLKVRYRKSYLGMLWTTLIPAANAIVYFIVFKYVMNVGFDNYLLFIISGFLPWTMFNGAVMGGMESLVLNHALLSKVKLPLQSLIYAENATHVLNFLFSMPVLLIIFLLSTAGLSLNLLAYPVIIFHLIAIAVSLGVILGIGLVYLRDLRHMMVIIFQILFYLTPIIYRFDMVPEKFRFLLYLNPVGGIFILNQAIWIGVHQGPDVIYTAYASTFTWTIALVLIALSMLKNFQFKIVERL